jgi:hypothetical protein
MVVLGGEEVWSQAAEARPALTYALRQARVTLAIGRFRAKKRKTKVFFSAFLLDSGYAGFFLSITGNARVQTGENRCLASRSASLP